MTQLAFIASADQLESIKRSHVPSRDCVVATTDLDVWVELSSTREGHINLWRYLDSSSAELWEKTAWELCARVATALQGAIVFRGCDIAERIQNDLFHAFVYVLNTTHMVSKALIANRPECVVYFQEMARSVYWDAADNPPDVFNASVAFCAEEARIADRRTIALQPVRETNGAVYQASHSARRSLPEQVQVVSLGPGLGLNESWMLLDAASRLSRPSWLLLEDGANPFPMASLRMTSLLNLPYDLDSFVRSVSCIEERVMKALEMDPRGSWIVQNPHFGFLWREYAGWAINAARWYAFGDFLADALKPDVVLTGYDVFGALKCFTEALQKRGIHTVSIHHSALDLVGVLQRHQGVRGDVATWGYYDSQHIKAWREKEGRIIEVGSLRRDLAPLCDSQALARPLASAMGSKPRVVLLTARVTDPCFAAASSSDHYACWQELGDFIARHPEWDFVIKPHPRYDYYRLYEMVIGRSPGNVRLFKGPAGDVLSSADVAMEINAPSTVAIEATAVGVPVVYLKNAVYSYQKASLEEGGVVSVGSVAAAEQEVNKLLNDTHYRAIVLETQRAFLKKAVSASGEEAGRRMIGVIEGMLAASRKETGDPSARWILDILMCVDYGMRGDLTNIEFTRRMADLRANGHNLRFDHIRGVKTDDLGSGILNWAVWQSWPVEGKLSMPFVIWSLFRAIPPSLQLSWRCVRMSVIHSFLVQADREAGKSVRRIKWLLFAALMSPGRLRAILAGQPMRK